MARFFITGSSDGLGLLTAQSLVRQGHRVVLHARNEQRAKVTSEACPEAEKVLVADISSIAETKSLANDLNNLGKFDCIIHNAALYLGPYRKSVDGFPSSFAVNTLAPYILTCLVTPPSRLVYISSGLHRSGDGALEDISWQARGERKWNDMQGYCDTKLQIVLLAFAVARKWPTISSSALDPGWVPTKMGGRSATGDLQKAVDTYLMLATGKGDAPMSGKYYYQSKEESPKSVTRSEATQERLLATLEGITGLRFPTDPSA